MENQNNSRACHVGKFLHARDRKLHYKGWIIDQNAHWAQQIHFRSARVWDLRSCQCKCLLRWATSVKKAYVQVCVADWASNTIHRISSLNIVENTLKFIKKAEALRLPNLCFIYYVEIIYFRIYVRLQRTNPWVSSLLFPIVRHNEDILGTPCST